MCKSAFFFVEGGGGVIFHKFFGVEMDFPWGISWGRGALCKQ